jgi:hypothetical protein
LGGADEPLEEITRCGAAAGSAIGSCSTTTGSGAGSASTTGSGAGSASTTGSGAGSASTTDSAFFVVAGFFPAAGFAAFFVVAGFFPAAGFAAFFFVAGFFLAAGFAASGCSGCRSRVRPSRTALRRARSACASTIPEEWLLVPMPREPQRSRTSALVIPSSRANS